MPETAHKKRILVVEDEKNIAMLLAYNLMQAGYAYDIAYDGEDGLKKALGGGYDLILLDLMLPKLDGFEVCRRIREKLSTPIIIATARVEEVDKVMGLGAGADDYMTKPFSPRELIARCEALLRRNLELVTLKTDFEVELPSQKAPDFPELVKFLEEMEMKKSLVNLRKFAKDFYKIDL